MATVSNDWFPPPASAFEAVPPLPALASFIYFNGNRARSGVVSHIGGLFFRQLMITVIKLPISTHLLTLPPPMRILRAPAAHTPWKLLIVPPNITLQITGVDMQKVGKSSVS